MVESWGNLSILPIEARKFLAINNHLIDTHSTLTPIKNVLLPKGAKIVLLSHDNLCSILQKADSDRLLYEAFSVPTDCLSSRIKNEFSRAYSVLAIQSLIDSGQFKAYIAKNSDHQDRARANYKNLDPMNYPAELTSGKYADKVKLGNVPTVSGNNGAAVIRSRLQAVVDKFKKKYGESIYQSLSNPDSDIAKQIQRDMSSIRQMSSFETDRLMLSDVQDRLNKVKKFEKRFD